MNVIKQRMLCRSKQQGVTLVEMVIAIAVAGIAISGLAAAFSNLAGRTADPMIQTQAQVATEALMDEILLRPFIDPTSGATCSTIPANRSDFDDVCDYRGYTTSGVFDASGNSIEGLETYEVSVSVTQSAVAGVTSSNSFLITVTTRSPLDADIVLSAYRMNY